MFRCVILFITLFLLNPMLGVGQTTELAQAMQLGEAGKTEEAIKVYEDIIATGESSVDVLYNLGTLYLQEKQISKSILHLERALKHQPNNKNARINLEIARSEIKDPIFAISPFFLLSYWRKFSNVLPMNIWAILSLMFLGALAFMLNKVLFASMSRKQKWAGMGLITACLLLSLLAAFTRYGQLKNDDYAVVMSEVDRLEGPDVTSKNEEFPVISEGIKVQITDSFESYYKVKLPDSDESWIPKEKLERI